MKSILEDGIGTPLIWIYSYYGEILRDNQGRTINQWVDKFEYSYEEENDDKCTISFNGLTTEQTNLIFFRPDIKLKVNWGYVLKNGRVLKSPTRTIAVRDIEAEYTSKGNSVKLICTDIVSYIKSFKSDVVRKYDNPNTQINAELLGRQNDNFIDWIFEVSEGMFIPTITDLRSSVRKDFTGGIQVAEYDFKTGRYSKAIENTAVKKNFMQEFYAGKVIKGKSKALKNAIDDYLKYLDAKSGLSGRYLADSTDETLHVHKRNYFQTPFKSYVWMGGSGELLSFKPKTQTRKAKDEITTSASINPMDKTIQDMEINSADTTSDKKDPIGTGVFSKKVLGGRVSEAALREYYRRAREIFLYNRDNPDTQKNLPSLRYAKTSEDYKEAGVQPVQTMGQRYKHAFVTIPAKEVINSPEFHGMLENSSSEKIKAQYRNEQNVVGYMLNKIERKYNAEMVVLGDPSLIKGKIYSVFGLSYFDSGNWYAKAVKHIIDMQSGYLVKMEVLKKPSVIGFNKSELERKMEEDGNLVKPKDTINDEDYNLHEEPANNIMTEKQELQSTIENIRNEETEGGILSRLKALRIEEGFTLGKDSLKRDNTENISTDSIEPNADKF